MTETKSRDRIPLNECLIKTINGTHYKVHSIYTGDRDFRNLYENLAAEKAAQSINGHCNVKKDAV